MLKQVSILLDLVIYSEVIKQKELWLDSKAFQIKKGG
ncbi:MAG: hypothetical protein CM15mP36_16500 [Flavobacteriales bacterium]|nr:MAG: hypothetical protein CM15mP36_16500 [Flavobacteriales bacterium]